MYATQWIRITLFFPLLNPGRSNKDNGYLDFFLFRNSDSAGLRNGNYGQMILPTESSDSSESEQVKGALSEV